MTFTRIFHRGPARLRRRRTPIAVGLAGTMLIAASVTGAAAEGSGPVRADGSTSPGKTITAHYFAQVAPLDPPGSLGHITSLEGPAFGPDGDLYMVHSTAPADQPKVIALDLRTREVRGIHKDPTALYASLQFSPADGKIYLTDLNGGIDRVNPDGTGYTTVVSGSVLGRQLAPDDIAFDQNGAMFVTDFQGTPWEPTGRVIRFDPDGTHPTVLMDGLAGANGISFDPEYSALWVSEFRAGRVDHLPLSADRTKPAGGYAVPSVGMYGNEGVGGFDSNAVDADGNIYQCAFGDGKIYVYSPHGTLLATIVVPQTMPAPQLLTTNLVIKPGTHDGYLVVGGDNGGFVYTFRALGLGDAQSNGGGTGA
ncbi:SMP-30/gluconolactonase/LRE family protein [Streptomyces mirabilis]|uniref:Lactonase n=1 Tax=Streptomyces mirabilis TaxID=68239 RepID=A0A1I2SRI0_9ACTN|nr:SMP-30/gluconolactonase/LRE family protein [Streptomyces mirabilis]SFG52756.1 lactonase [Streptomyces mirabilis]